MENQSVVLENQKQLETPTQAEPTEQKVKLSRGPKGWNLKLKFPAIPVRGLWEKATLEDKQRAQEFAKVIMEYWMGRLSRAQAITKVGMRPVRFWQLTQQAIAGMTAGLLTQPRFRKGEFMGKNEQQEIKKLEAKVKDLELMVATQQKLIEVFKSIPGYQGAITDDETTRVSTGRKKGNGLVVKDSAKRKSGEALRNTGSHHANSQSMEEKN